MTGINVPLRKKYGAPIAMHPNDAGMVRRGDMSHSRKAKPDRITTMGRVILLVGRLMTLVNRGSFDCFSPDVYLEDGQSLSAYGFDAKVLHLPAHSRGSIGVLTPDGELVKADWKLTPFCRLKSDPPSVIRFPLSPFFEQPGRPAVCL